jgi:hypothetical protein
MLLWYPVNMLHSTDETCTLISAIHTNRTVTLKTDYDLLDHEFKQKSVLHLDPQSWASYDLTIINKTTVSSAIVMIIFLG